MSGKPAFRRFDEGPRGRIVAHTPGGEAKITWIDQGDIRTIDHTLLPPSERGTGLAAALVEAAVEAARVDGRRVVPACSYVAAQFRRRPEWRDQLA